MSKEQGRGRYLPLDVGQGNDEHYGKPDYQLIAERFVAQGGGSEAVGTLMETGVLNVTQNLPTDPKARKDVPLFDGLFKYFPKALCAVAELSRIGNEQHNPGQPMHWAREKSSDHGNCLLRHQMDVGSFDTDSVRHATKVAWRSLAQLELEIEASMKAEG